MEDQLREDKGFLRDNGRYILIVRRGDKITDVWKLEGADIRYNERTKGWVVASQNCSTFFVSADVEIWSVKENDEDTWLKYKEYHQIESAETKDHFINTEPVKEPKSFFRSPFKFQKPVVWNW